MIFKYQSFPRHMQKACTEDICTVRQQVDDMEELWESSLCRGENLII